jgi:hypothetical protein
MVDVCVGADTRHFWQHAKEAVKRYAARLLKRQQQQLLPVS